jgi:hypothetical protein
MKELTLGIINIECLNCNTKYKEYKMSDFVYGERLFYTEINHYYAYCNCLEDKYFNEISDFVDIILKKKKYFEKEKKKIFNNIFGYICDLVNNERIIANDDSIWSRCKICNSTNIKISNKEPQIELETISLPEVTYKDWNKLNKNQKMEKIIKLYN